MRFACDSCSAQYMISDEKVGPNGVKVRCKKCGHVILVRRAPEQVPADAHRLTQVLDNLLDNAVRYSQPGGEVSVTVWPKELKQICERKNIFVLA